MEGWYNCFVIMVIFNLANFSLFHPDLKIIKRLPTQIVDSLMNVDNIAYVI